MDPLLPADVPCYRTRVTTNFRTETGIKVTNLATVGSTSDHPRRPRLARIALPQTGRYLIVVSANYGRGAYWLALSEGAEG